MPHKLGILYKIALWISGVVLSAVIGVYVAKYFQKDPKVETSISTYSQEGGTWKIGISVDNYGEVDLSDVRVVVEIDTAYSGRSVRLVKSDVRLTGDNRCTVSFRPRRPPPGVTTSLPEVIELECQNFYVTNTIDLIIPLRGLTTSEYSTKPYSGVLLILVSKEHKYQTFFNSVGGKRYEWTGNKVSSPFGLSEHNNSLQPTAKSGG